MNLRLPFVLAIVAAAVVSSPISGQGCTVRSGSQQVRYSLTTGSTPFTAAELAAAASGPTAPLSTTLPLAWLPALPCDPLARWISVPSNPSGGSALLEVIFPCQMPPCTLAALTVCFAVDNNLGRTAGSVTINEGLYFNGVPLTGTTLPGGGSANFTAQTVFADIDVTGLVRSGNALNRLQLFLHNDASQNGIMFSARLSVPVGLNPPLCIPCNQLGSFVPTMSGALATDPQQRNDDGSTNALPLGFDFCFFGRVYTEIYVNNNGNVTLDAPFGFFNRSAFPMAAVKMIAPLWADVDTRNVSSGTVTCQAFPTRFVVTWTHVGYFDQHADRFNTFQVILSNGNDAVVGGGKNVRFCYGNMDWTTGDASGGSGGLGGTPATVGINAGDGLNSVRVGRFDQTGSAYDGPAGNPDGIDWLDGQTMAFDVGGCCGQIGQAGIADLTVNGEYSGAGSVIPVYLSAGAVVTFAVSAPPFAQVTLLYSLDCFCPGFQTPYGNFHLDLASYGVLFDGCGLFGPPTALGATGASGSMSVSYSTPPSFAGLCFCVQGIVCHPALAGSIKLTQAYRLCFD